MKISKNKKNNLFPLFILATLLCIIPKIGKFTYDFAKEHAYEKRKLELKNNPNILLKENR